MSSIRQTNRWLPQNKGNFLNERRVNCQPQLIPYNLNCKCKKRNINNNWPLSKFRLSLAASMRNVPTQKKKKSSLRQNLSLVKTARHNSSLPLNYHYKHRNSEQLHSQRQSRRNEPYLVKTPLARRRDKTSVSADSAQLRVRERERVGE